MVVAINSWEYLKLVGTISFHLRLMPNIDSTNLDVSFILFGKLLPKRCKVMTQLLSRIVDLNDPNPVWIIHEALVIIRGQSQSIRGYLWDITTILIVMFAFFRVTKNLPSLHNRIKFVLATVTVRILIRMILYHEFFILIFQISICDRTGNL